MDRAGRGIQWVIKTLSVLPNLKINFKLLTPFYLLNPSEASLLLLHCYSAAVNVVCSATYFVNSKEKIKSYGSTIFGEDDGGSEDFCNQKILSCHKSEDISSFDSSLAHIMQSSSYYILKYIMSNGSR